MPSNRAGCTVERIRTFSCRTVVELLLLAGMDVNVRTGNGTALHEAAQCGKTEVARTLLDHGINTHIRDIHRRTVEDLLKQFPPKAGPAVEITAMLQSTQNITAGISIISYFIGFVSSAFVYLTVYLKITSSITTTRVTWKPRGEARTVMLRPRRR